VEITATDDYNDGHNVSIGLSESAVGILTEQHCYSHDGDVRWLGTLFCSQTGSYLFTAWATDGNLVSAERVQITVEAVVMPTPTPTAVDTPTMTPTPTPTPWPIIVRDNLYSGDDLSGQTDCDDLKGRELCVRWRVKPAANIKQIHVYVSQNGNAPEYLGQPEKTNDDYLIWQRGNFSNISRALRNGPEAGNDYQFFTYFIYSSRFREGPYTHSGAVRFELAAAPPVPENAVIITDNPDSWRNYVVNSIFRLNRENNLTVKWNINYSDVASFNVYLVNPNGQSYLGCSQSNYLAWSPLNPNINPDFRAGPQNNENYKFRVYALKPDHYRGHPSYYGPFETGGYVRVVKTGSISDDLTY